MTLQLATIPEDAAELARWLEPKIASLELVEVVAELAVLFPPSASAPPLEEIVGRHADDVLENGLAALPENRLRALLELPNRLLDFQLWVMSEDSDYWRKLSQSADSMEGHVRIGRQRLQIAENEEERPVALPRRSGRTLAWSAFTGLATAAAVMVAVWVMKPFGTPAGGWGWSQAGILAQATGPREHLENLAKGADQWFNKQPQTAAELGARIAEMRRGCSQLILGEHPQLDKDQREWLVGKCKEWAVKLDQQLAALESGSPLAEVQKNADDVVRKLSNALRTKANEIG